MRIGVASDHAGFRYKTLVAQHLRRLGHEVQDFGTVSEEPVDYPDFIRPLELKYGEYVMFDPRCIHATQNNKTEHTRISIDLRVLPQGERPRMRIDYRGTGRLRMLFAPGHYYDERLSTEL